MHGVQFKVFTCDVRKWLHGILGINEPSVNISPHGVLGMNDLSKNGLKEMSVNGLN